MYEVSIVICSKKSYLDQALATNINDTIGCKYEVNFIDNTKNRYSIFQAYNNGLKSSQYPYVVFIHDDILFHSTDWGNIIASYFSENPKAGLVGVAGSKIKTRMPSGWWQTRKENLHVNVLQHYRKERVSNDLIGFRKNSFEEVAVVDGVFLALRKDLRIKFNEDLYGFHNYDTSLCADIKQLGYKIFATNTIQLEHFSTGMIDSCWVKSTFRFYRRYKGKLPIKAGGVDVRKKDEEYSLVSFIYTCLSTRDRLLALRLFLKYLWINPVSKHHLRIIKLLLSPKKPWVKV